MKVCEAKTKQRLADERLGSGDLRCPKPGMMRMGRKKEPGTFQKSLGPDGPRVGLTTRSICGRPLIPQEAVSQNRPPPTFVRMMNLLELI